MTWLPPTVTSGRQFLKLATRQTKHEGGAYVVYIYIVSIYLPNFRKMIVYQRPKILGD